MIVTESNRPVAAGYNGPPSGWKLPDGSTCQDWCPRAAEGLQTRSYDNCVTVHAEVNALMWSDRRDYAGGTLYVTSAICWDCGKAVANSGLSRVVCKVDMARDLHRDPMRTINFLRDCGLDVEVWQDA